MNSEHASEKSSLETDICEALDNSIPADQNTRDRLAEIRQKALAALPEGKSKKSRSYFWYIAGGSISVCLLTAIVILNPDFQSSNSQPQLSKPELSQTASTKDPITELEWLLVNDDLAMMENELAFYSWADDEIEKAVN